MLFGVRDTRRGRLGDCPFLTLEPPKTDPFAGFPAGPGMGPLSGLFPQFVGELPLQAGGQAVDKIDRLIDGLGRVRALALVEVGPQPDQVIELAQSRFHRAVCDPPGEMDEHHGDDHWIAVKDVVFVSGTLSAISVFASAGGSGSEYPVILHASLCREADTFAGAEHSGDRTTQSGRQKYGWQTVLPRTRSWSDRTWVGSKHNRSASHLNGRLRSGYR